MGWTNNAIKYMYLYKSKTAKDDKWEASYTEHNQEPAKHPGWASVFLRWLIHIYNINLSIQILNKINCSLQPILLTCWSMNLNIRFSVLFLHSSRAILTDKLTKYYFFKIKSIRGATLIRGISPLSYTTVHPPLFLESGSHLLLDNKQATTQLFDYYVTQSIHINYVQHSQPFWKKKKKSHTW